MRLLAWVKKLLGKSEPERILVDREGVAYVPERPVKLKGKG